MIVGNHIQKDRFAELSGIELLDAEKGKASARMPITDRLLNGLGTIQGGALFTLADYTFAAAVNSLGGEVVTLDATISFLRPASCGCAYAEAVPVKIGKTIMTYNVDIYLEKGGKLLSSFRATAYRKE